MNDVAYRGYSNGNGACAHLRFSAGLENREMSRLLGFCDLNSFFGTDFLKSGLSYHSRKTPSSQS